jgi:hypothetical protein
VRGSLKISAGVVNGGVEYWSAVSRRANPWAIHSQFTTPLPSSIRPLPATLVLQPIPARQDNHYRSDGTSISIEFRLRLSECCPRIAAGKSADPDPFKM